MNLTASTLRAKMLEQAEQLQRELDISGRRAAGAQRTRQVHNTYG